MIGSDQVALRGDEILGKPGDADRCRAQLAASSGRAAAVSHRRVRRDRRRRAVLRAYGPHHRQFRKLDAYEIARYVDRDRPWDCAGGFKGESLGIALCERIETLDPSALTGLPLIWLAGVLRQCGLSVP